MLRIFRFLCPLIGIGCLPAIALAAEDPDLDRPYEDAKGIFNVVWENDIFGGTDQNYTNGIRFAWLSSEEQTPEWVRSFASTLTPFESEGHKRISIAFGQSMFTPDDPVPRNVIPNDRPYAGWLYGTLGVVSDRGDVLENMGLTIGMVGPAALAEPTQDFIHDLTDSPHFNGWDNQLNNEPGIILSYERKWRSLVEFSPFGLGADITPHAGFNLGNIHTDAALGATFRLGYDLPQDYGPPRIRPSMPGSDFFIPSQSLSGYLFAGVEGRAVGRNIFLDGNTFEDSPSVDKEWAVGSLQLGAAVTYGNTRISYTHVFMTEEFKTQDKPAQLGAITLSYRF